MRLTFIATANFEEFKMNLRCVIGNSLLTCSILFVLERSSSDQFNYSLRASSPIWASEASLAKTRERAAKPRGAEAPRSRVFARLASLAQIGELARRLVKLLAKH